MRTLPLFSKIIIGLIVSFTMFALSMPTKSFAHESSNENLSVLKQKIINLEKTVHQLQNKLNNLGKSIKAYATLLESQIPKGTKIPKNWIPYEINGVTYYFIPLDTYLNETPPPAFQKTKEINSK